LFPLTALDFGCGARGFHSGAGKKRNALVFDVIELLDSFHHVIETVATGTPENGRPHASASNKPISVSFVFISYRCLSWLLALPNRDRECRKNLPTG
jgi:hypothetical protein